MSLDGDNTRASKSLTLAQRVSMAERDLGAHAQALNRITVLQADFTKQLAALEDWRMNRLLAEVREDERDKALSERLGRIEKSIETGLSNVQQDVKNLRGGFTRAFWIAAGTIIPAVILGIALVIVFGATGFLPTK